MAHLSILSIPLLLLSVSCISGAVEPAWFAKRPQAQAYVETACTKTLHPSLCIQYLSVFPNSTIQTPEQLARAALSVSLYKALQTRKFVSKVVKELKAMKSKDYQVVKDCSDQICDSVYRLSQSIRELRGFERTEAAGRRDIFWHISNIETWVSSAMTCASTCVDQFPERNMSKLKAIIKTKVLNVEETTSVALALFHRFAAKYYKP